LKVLNKINKGNFIKKFTSHPDYEAGCYFQIDIIEGCPYDCGYCFLKHYLKNPDIIVYDNLEKIQKELASTKANYINLSVTTDGSMLSLFPGLSRKLFDILRKFPNKYFEIRFKHKKVMKLLELDPPKNVIFTSTISGITIADKLEIGTSSTIERIDALSIFENSGYKIGIIMDPIILYEGWKEEYGKIFSIANKKLSRLWRFGVGLLRLERSIFPIFLERINNSVLKGKLLGEFTHGDDNKYRYYYNYRINTYKTVLKLASVMNIENILFYMEKKDVKRQVLS
jgi:spore photoproduct lyase